MTTSPRVTILCAVSEIREFHGEDAFLMAVADLLDASAARIAAKVARGGDEQAVWSHEKFALAVARAFLDKEATS